MPNNEKITRMTVNRVVVSIILFPSIDELIVLE